MADPIYGDRRCPTCQSIKETAEDSCWNCNRRPPNEGEVASAMAETIAKEVDAQYLDAVDQYLANKTTDHLTASELSNLLYPPSMDALAAKIIEKHGPALEAASRSSIQATDATHRAAVDALILRVRAWQSTDIHSDAVQLASWLKRALDEVDDLRDRNKRLIARIDELLTPDPGR